MADGKYEDWVTVFTTGTDYEADLVRDRLDDSDIPAVVLTQRDHAFNLNVGDLSAVRVMVPPDYAEAAVDLIQGEMVSDEELEEAALQSDPDAPDAHSPHDEAILDSGNEQIHVGDQEDEEESA
jgi:hypothetical protein